MSAQLLPQSLGRYRVLGELATGGMAEILLARLEGPSGFSRPVVIKRILPHFARQQAFRSMFLDEGRIVAGIRHPNVVQVHELANENDELFLVMEYLEGESASGLMKRLKAGGVELAPRLAAYIVAETCAGLHAAHELEDDAGSPQHLVHRDVSPQNLIVTYDGHVKLLDFGVALVADRMSRTEVGTLKGKVAYMSPEQCTGQRLDRRSDIFSLATVLYELSTGRLLFRRDNPAATIRAICDEPVLPPTRLVSDYPPVLAEVCLRALSTSPDDRYATCADMRAALLEALREMGSIGEEEAQLSALMREHFADRVAEKRELLRRVKVGAEDVGAIPAGEVDVGIELPTTAAKSSSMNGQTPRRSRAPVWIGLALVTVLGVLGAARALHLAPTVVSDLNPPVTVAPVPASLPQPVLLPRPAYVEAQATNIVKRDTKPARKPASKSAKPARPSKSGDDYQRFE